jgi:hypothetical protein
MAAMGTIFERWQQVEHQLATEDRVHAFYRGCEALWDLKLDQFQQQLDALIDEERRSVAGPPRVGSSTRSRSLGASMSRAPPNCAPPGAARPPVKRWKPIALQNVLDSVQPLLATPPTAVPPPAEPPHAG